MWKASDYIKLSIWMFLNGVNITAKFKKTQKEETLS